MQGVGVGLAAAIKLTPLIFVVYLVATRRARAAAVTVGSFVATVLAGFLLLPADSHAFWLGGVFLRSRRVGNAIDLADQSLAGAIARLVGGSDQGHAWWYAAAALTAIGGLAVAVWAHRRGHRLAGVVCCGITGLLISPISWTHHWIWAVPLLTVGWIGLAAVLTAIVFSNAAALLSTWGSFGLGRILSANAYVWCGAAFLVATALFLWRGRDPRTCRSASMGSSAPWSRRSSCSATRIPRVAETRSNRYILRHIWRAF